ncbi:MAG: radical SAM/SPASM domain-containing protein [Kiritimatiellia bacterium]
MCPNKELAADAKGIMKFDLYRKIIDEIKDFANDIYLHHRGEPLINPRLCEMIAYAGERGLKTRFHTNGTLLNPDKGEKLLEASPTLVSFSVDGFDKESYENIRVGAEFEKTVENITAFAKARKTAGLRKPYLVVEKIRFRNPPPSEKPEQVLALKQRFLDSGVDEVIEKDEYVWAEENAPELETKQTYSVCTFPWYAMVICADGTVTPCPQDFGAEMRMGNVNTATLREIWHGKPYADLRRKFAEDIQSLPLCRKCDRLARKTAGGIPLQYAATFLIDQLVGYGRLRKTLGTMERRS